MDLPVKPEIRFSGLLLVSLVLFPSLVFADSSTNFFQRDKQWGQKYRYFGQKEFTDFQKGVEPVKRKVWAAQPASDQDGDNITSAEESAADTERVLQVELDLADFKLVDQTIELEAGQTLTIKGRGIQRVLSTHPDVVDAGEARPDSVELTARTIGSAFIHLWDESGRLTRSIRVIRPRHILTDFEKHYLQAVEGGESFKFEVNSDRSAFYEGNGFEGISQSSLSYTERFAMRGDTPYGDWDSHVTLREFETDRKLSELSMHLRDARIAGLSGFDLNLADDLVSPGLLSLPSVRLRGVNIETLPLRARNRLTAYFGRELGSFLGTVSPGLSTELESKDSFLGGFVYDIPYGERVDTRVAMSHGYGQNRDDSLNNQSFEVAQSIKINDPMKVRWDLATDSEHAAYTVAHDWSTPAVKIRTALRDISKKFFTMVGNPPDQGELGVRFNVQWKPMERLYLDSEIDTFRDRLFPNPEDPQYFNLNQDYRAVYYFDPRFSAELHYENSDETGRLSPFRSQRLSGGLRRSVELWGRHVSLFGLYSNQDYESLNNPDLNYRNDRVTLGFQTPLVWNIMFALSQQLNYLELPTTGELSHPHSTQYSLSRSAQVGKTPFYTTFSVRFQDEEETESERSFMTQEDRMSFLGSIIYRKEDKEFFVEARYDNIEGEGIDIESSRSEAEVRTGVRLLWDTQKKWEPRGAYRGFVFNDLNADGKRQDGEAGIPNMKVHVGTHVLTTDEKGYFESPAVTGRKVAVVLDDAGIPYGFTGTTPFRQSVEADAADKDKIFFGLTAKSTLYGQVYDDENYNGRFDPQEQGVSETYLVLDGGKRVKTDLWGRYRFVDVALGNHEVRLDMTSLRQGYLPRDRATKTAEVHEGVSYRLDFPVKSQRVLSGRVFDDTNQNSRIDSDESGIAGLSVRLGDKTSVTDDGGYYYFEDILPGTQKLTVDADPGNRYLTDFEMTYEIPKTPYSKEQPIPLKKK